MNITKLLDTVMQCDHYVRFAVILDSNGNKIDSRTKDGITNFLPPVEMELSIEHAIDSWKFRKKLSKYVGKNQFVLAVYDNVRRVTLPIDDSHLMLVAFDNKGGQADIVNRIQTILEGDYTKPISHGPQY